MQFFTAENLGAANVIGVLFGGYLTFFLYLLGQILQDHCHSRCPQIEEISVSLGQSTPD